MKEHMMDIAGDLLKVTQRVTKKWTKQRKAEERSQRARYARWEAMCSRSRTAFTEVMHEVIPAAYFKASCNGTLPAHARQIFYAARPLFLERTGEEIKSTYFTQTLLPKYLNEHAVETADWWVAYDARGHLSEPHSDSENVPLGTLEVDEYLRGIRDHVDSDALDALDGISTTYPTRGPGNRYTAILFVEKEGFNALFAAVGLADRYDLAVMSTKGESVVAARKLVDHLCSGNVPVLTLHDFDVHGFEIAFNLVRVSSEAEVANCVRYQFCHEVNHIDLGLRLEDIEKYGLLSERVKAKPVRAEVAKYLRMTRAELDFLAGHQRVELNAFSSHTLVEWIEAKLKQHGIKKVIPETDVLEKAWPRACQIQLINAQLRELKRDAGELAEGIPAPKTLSRRIAAELKKDPRQSWDQVLAQMACAAAERALRQ
jgi:hypothetical protein